MNKRQHKKIYGSNLFKFYKRNIHGDWVTIRPRLSSFTFGAGTLSGGRVTDNGNGTVNIEAATVNLRGAE